MSFQLLYHEEDQSFDFGQKSITVGRSQSSDLTLDHPTVSRQHAVIEKRGDRFVLIVMSQNGLTAVNQTPVEGEVTIPSGAILNFGKIGLEFHSEEASSDLEAKSPEGPGDDEIGAEATSSDNVSESDDDSDDTPGGIGSWDDIAESEEAKKAERQRQESKQQSLASSDSSEESSPIIWVIVGIMGVGILALTLFSGGGGGNSKGNKQKGSILEQKPVVLEINCLDKSTCKQKAKEAYQLGLQRVKEKDVRVGRLFNGYKKLLAAKKYLEKGGFKTPPKGDFPELEPKLKESRNELDQIFKNYRVQYFHHQKQQNYQQMASSLRSIKQKFPDPSAREHKWADKQEQRMRQKGIYPSTPY